MELIGQFVEDAVPFVLLSDGLFLLVAAGLAVWRSGALRRFFRGEAKDDD